MFPNTISSYAYSPNYYQMNQQSNYFNSTSMFGGFNGCYSGYGYQQQPDSSLQIGLLMGLMVAAMQKQQQNTTTVETTEIVEEEVITPKSITELLAGRLAGIFGW